MSESLSGVRDRVKTPWFAAMAVATSMFLACLGCGGNDAPRLYCGAGIRPPVEKLAKEFGEKHGVTIEVDYAGSEVLLGRIKLTGQGDLYMPGDRHYIEQADEAGLIVAEKTRDVCYFVPVILVGKDNPHDIRSLDDLKNAELNIGLGDPKACAVGRKTVKLLSAGGIDREDLNVVTLALTVNDLGNQVALGKLDAAIVWDAVAGRFSDKTVTVEIPRPKNIISTVPIAVLKSSKHPELAEKFVEFVASERGTEVFREHHYTTSLDD